MLLSRCLSQGQNLTSEFFMTRLGQGSFQDTDPRDEVASVSQPRKPCNLFFWKTGILATTQSVPKLKTVDCRHNTTWQGFLWWCCLALSNKLHGHTCALLWVASPGEELWQSILLPCGWQVRSFAGPSKVLPAAQSPVLGGAGWPCHWLSLISALTQSRSQIISCGCPGMLEGANLAGK